jgi:hypothetical protein
MRIRRWLMGLLLLGLCAAWGPSQSQAAFWPFSLFTTTKPPIKKPKKPKPGHPRPGYGSW